jgi:hypothetical protein
MFLHKLALGMGRTVSELRATLTTDELALWMAFNKTNPIGPERIDYLFARLCVLICDVAGAKKKAGGHFSLEDFILWKPKDMRKPIDFMKSMFGARLKKKHV